MSDRVELDPAGGAIREIPHPRDLSDGAPFTLATTWYACGDPPPVDQGWKLYVSATMHNAAEIIERVAAVVLPAGLHLKYVKNLRTLCKLNAGTYGYAQIGKDVVVYLPEPDGDLLSALKRTLTGYRHECPLVPCARAIGDGLPLHYRYGAYRDSFITIAGREVVDDRLDSRRAVPAGIEDALATHCLALPADADVAAFLTTYPIFRALRQQGKAGVFHCMNLASETFEEVVLKVGYHRGGVQADGSDGCTLLRRELAFYRLLRERGLDHLAPGLVDALDVPRKVILALEHLPSCDLLTEKLEGRLTVRQLDRAWRILEELHEHGLHLGDAKLGNFLLCDDGRLCVVDFEAAGIVGRPAPRLRTFLLRPEPAEAIVHDRVHFLASVLFRYDGGPDHTDARRVDVDELRARRPSDDVSAWALGRLEASVSP